MAMAFAEADPARVQAPGRERVAWLDIAKGLGIVVVVIGHALGGIIDSPAGQGYGPLRYAFTTIYIFHMPLFFLLTGLLVRSRLAKGEGRFAIDLARTIVFPYFLWSIVQYSAIYAAGSLVNQPVSTYWPTILALPWRTVSQFWFLYVLFVLHAAALLIVPRIGARAFLAIVLVAKLLLPLLALPVMIRLSVTHAPFYALGVLLGIDGVAGLLRSRFARSTAAVAALCISGIVATVLACAAIMFVSGNGYFGLQSRQIAAIAWHVEYLPAAFLATAALIAAADRMTGPCAAACAYLGRSTMAIYVLHILFIAGTRIALTRHGQHHDPLLILAAIVAIGLAGPLIVRALAERIGMGRMLGLS